MPSSPSSTLARLSAPVTTCLFENMKAAPPPPTIVASVNNKNPFLPRNGICPKFHSPFALPSDDTTPFSDVISVTTTNKFSLFWSPTWTSQFEASRFPGCKSYPVFPSKSLTKYPSIVIAWCVFCSIEKPLRTLSVLGINPRTKNSDSASSSIESKSTVPLLVSGANGLFQELTGILAPSPSATASASS